MCLRWGDLQLYWQSLLLLSTHKGYLLYLVDSLNFLTMPNYLKFFLGLVILISCNSDLELRKSLISPDHSFTDSIGLKINHELIIRADSFLTFIRPTIYNDTILITLIKEKPGVLGLFDIKNGKYLRKIEVAADVFREDRVTTFYVHNLDSIFFLSSSALNVNIVNGNGSILKTWTYQDLGINPPGIFIYPYFLPQYRPIYQSKLGLLHISLIPAFFTTKEGFESTPLQSVINLKENAVKLKYGPPEGVMKLKSKRNYPADLSFPYSLVIGDTTYVSFPMDHFVYVYNNTTGNLLFKSLTSSRAVRELPLPLPEESIKDTQETWNFRVQTPFYEPLYFHEKANLFSRAIHHPQSLKDDMGLLNAGKNRLTSVIILDKNMKIVGETIFTNGQHPIHGSIPVSDGLLLISNETDSTIINIPHIKYEFFRKNL